MICKLRLPLAGFLAALLVGGSLSATRSAQDEDPPERVTVEEGPFVVEIDLEGSFDQPDAAVVACRPEVYKGALKVKESAAPGPVEAGQRLVECDLEEYERQLEAARLEVAIARAQLERKRHETTHQEAAAALALESSRNALEKSERTLENYREVLMPIRYAEADLSLKSSRQRLQEEEQQFEQLVKMYASDDLVEETEDIVLNRARRSLEQQRTRMGFTEKRHELDVKFDIPRELEGHEYALRKAAADHALAEKTFALGRQTREAELLKAERALARQERDLGLLEADRDALRLLAPCAGLAVRGELNNGKWVKLSNDEGAFEVDDKLVANQALYTVVQAAPTVVRATVTEAQVLEVRPGQEATITPAALPDQELAATVRRVAPVSTNGSFEVELEVHESDARLLPGHRCGVAVKVLEVEAALCVPESALEREQGQAFVKVWSGGEARPRAVELGECGDGRVQVLSGLAPGDEVQKVFDGKGK